MNIQKAILSTSIVAACAAVAMPSEAQASSHREAPAIAEDQFADNTDVYAFIKPNDPDTLVIVANYVPLLIPSSGPNFYRFSDSVFYQIRIDNDGDAIPDVRYEFDFDTTTLNGGTFLYNVGPIDDIKSGNLNVQQTYRLKKGYRRSNGNWRTEIIADDVPVAPWHVGDRTFPDGSYEGVAQQAISPTKEGGMVFAGPRDEPFFVDLHVFDLLGVAGAPTTDGVNVMSLVLEVPIDGIAVGAKRGEPGSRPGAYADGPESVVGIYATAHRRAVRIIRKRQDRRDAHFGSKRQVSRLAVPLVNEVVIPLQDKDNYNKTSPVDDVTNFGAYILNPELPGLLNLVLDAGCPPAPAEGRLDIVGVLSPFGTTPADLLRVDIRDGQTFDNSSFPNGRWLEDDVTDTMLTLACGSGDPLGDGVDANDLPFTLEMPYLASPHSGNPID